MSKKTALIAGASGLVGGHLLDLLLEDDYYDTVTSVGRKSLNKSHPKLDEVVVDFDELDHAAHMLNADHVFCCLGSTMKKAGSREVFSKVDHDYPLKLAEITKSNGVTILFTSSYDSRP